MITTPTTPNRPFEVRQGDVLLRRITPAEFEAKKSTATRSAANTLAYGEATGHHHSFSNAEDCGVATYVLDLPEGKKLEELSQTEVNTLGMLVEVSNPSGADLRHQEHDTPTLPCGYYEKIIQREYTPEGNRNVLD